MGTLKEIADKCKVSTATVSKALNDHRDISDETKKLVRKVAKEMNYFPNANARALKTRRTYNIGVLFEDEAKNGLTHDYFASVLDSFKRTVEKQGYDLTFVNTNIEGRNGLSLVEHCRYRGFDGVMIACMDFDDKQIQELISSKIPVVIIDYIAMGRISVVSDNISGIRDLLTYVYNMGHRKVAYVHGDDSAVSRDRVYSFKKTAQRLGLKIPNKYYIEAPYRIMTASQNATAALLDLPDPPTCIFYPDDYAAFGGMNEINERGLSIPDDISIAGYDGIRIGRHIKPELTTLRQDTETIGEKAGEKLISLIENPKGTKIEEVIVKGEVFEGNTVKDIRKKKS